MLTKSFLARACLALCLAWVLPASAEDDFAAGVGFKLSFGGDAPARANLALTAGRSVDHRAPATALVQFDWRPAVDRVATVRWALPLTTGTVEWDVAQTLRAAAQPFSAAAISR